MVVTDPKMKELLAYIADNNELECLTVEGYVIKDSTDIGLIISNLTFISQI